MERLSPSPLIIWQRNLKRQYVKSFPLRQGISAKVHFPYFDKGSLSRRAETVVGVRTFSSTSLLSLSFPTSKQSKRTAFIETEEIGSVNTSKLNEHVAVDVRIHSSVEYAALVNDQGDVFKYTLRSGSSP